MGVFHSHVSILNFENVYNQPWAYLVHLLHFPHQTSLKLAHFDSFRSITCKITLDMKSNKIKNQNLSKFSKIKQNTLKNIIKFMNHQALIKQ